MGSGLKAQNMTGIRAQRKGLRAQKNGIKDRKAFEPKSGIRFITRSKTLLSQYFSKCHAYDTFYTTTPPIPTHYLREMLRRILQENSFQFNGKDFLQTHGTAMGTKTAVSFADIFMAKIETAIIDQHSTRPLLWKRYIDNVFSLWDTNREEINNFIEHANNYNPTIKFTADISDKKNHLSWHMHLQRS